MLAGAAGGPKWLILHGMDQFLFEQWLPQSSQPIDLIGSSIGAWRYANYCKPSFRTAFEDFERIYFAQTYKKGATFKDISEEIYRILHAVFPDGCEADILNHPRYRINIFADACRGPIKFDQPWILGSGLLLATLLNTVSRNTMQWFLERYLFQHSQSPAIAGDDRFRTHSAILDEQNLKAAILASGSIPLVVEGIKIPGYEDACFRDGGLLDYHLTLNYEPTSDLVLMPHFSPKLVTTWLDKYTPWRAPDTSGMANTIIITPSEEFIQSLPLHKIPDRSDFQRFEEDDISRNQYWRECTERSQELAEAFALLLESDELLAKLEPLEALHP